MPLLVRCCSSAIPPAAASAEEMAGDTYCYALGEFGMMKFDRQKFIPLEKFMKVNSVFERAPTDRLISPISFFSAHPYFTSESAKQWIRAGYLQVHFANKLKLSISGAFVDGNVGVIEGINIIAFLKLDTNLSSSSSSVPEPYPMTFAGFSNFLQAKMREAYPDASSMSEGLEALMMLTISDDMVKGWLGRKQKQPGLLGAFGIPAPPGAQCNLKLLTKLERNHLEVLTRKAYSIPAPSTTSTQPAPAPSTTSTQPAVPAPGSSTAPASSTASTGSSNQIKTPPPNPSEAIVLDVHRHCTVHIVEDAHVARCSILPAGNQASLKKNPMGWKDGVHLMLHRFPSCKTFCSGLHDVVPTRDLFYLFVNLVVVSRGYSECTFFTNVKKVIFKRSGAIPDECRWRWLPQPAVPRPLWGRARRWHPRSLGNCTELQALLLSSNNLDDIIPPEIGRLKNLRAMDVSRNSLSGPVPAELWWLRSAVGACVVQSKLRMLCGGQGPHWRESCRVIGVLARA
ncbi:unnamed protein product [Miscanthus lutarioriparius]|uniref:Uncharacterized protein n=1 Tax=Miscanthus lutarioriparius TaxID=422564 RepID=A0A811RUC2_9POAL|nr:unnamed protein product [Miscanthus lutarioriparius]